MIKCPNCEKNFKNKYQVCTKCGYELTDLDKENIIESNNKKLKISLKLIHTSFGIYLGWIILFFIMYLCLYLFVKDFEQLAEQTPESGFGLFIIALIPIFLGLGFVYFLYIVFLVVQFGFTLSNICLEINLLSFKSIKPLKKKSFIYLCCSLGMFVLQIFSIHLIMFLYK